MAEELADHREPFVFRYKNWKGVTAPRRVFPIEVFYGVTDYHSDKEQWFLRATDIDKGAERCFAMNDIVGPVTRD